jgi:antitoxin (DNA-binding transcriptional repressor) of toxin-antitoxin stability system
MSGMAVIHVSEADAIRDFAGLLEQVREGAEVIIGGGAMPIAVVHAPVPPRRTFAEVIALMPKDSDAVMDDDFARDVQAAIDAHNEPWNPPAWD